MWAFWEGSPRGWFEEQVIWVVLEVVNKDIRVSDLGSLPASCLLLLEEDCCWVLCCCTVATETDGLVLERGDHCGG
jgi:hypothetical protein